MHVPSLHWFRRQQRTVARFVLAAFCLTWLQLAAMPCVMAIDAPAGAPVAAAQSEAPPMGVMPEGMVMAPGEHCMYCPPPDVPVDHSAQTCAFPHDPQVDSRAAFASVLLAPPPVAVLLVPHASVQAAVDFQTVAAAPPLAGTAIAVSFCRFLK